ncbi:MAG: dihydroorotase [Betaproteobacteria bacterium]|nr:dihydroorotase [Betaproteobacteria bacterium]
MKIHIKNGRLIDPASGTDARQDVFIAAGKIVAIGAPPHGYTANRTLDASGLVVCPGLVDLAVRLREPGFEYMATLESEMSAAAAGGVTSLACPPDTDPPLDEPGLVEMLKFRAKNLNQAHVYPIGALTVGLKGTHLTEMAELTDAGCVAFSHADAPLTDTQLLLRALQYAATFDFPVWLRPQDAGLARGGFAHDGQVATRLGLAAIPVCAETVALSAILLLARETGARIHLCRLSSAEGIDMVRQAKHLGLKVSCDIAIHHAHLSEMDIGYFDPNSPVDDDAKQLPFGEAETGATGVELLLPLTLKWAEESRLPLAQGLARITSDPARVLGINAGRLTPGASADICIFDPERYWKVEAQALKSQGKNTPFIGIEVKGRVRYTLVEGQFVFELDA